MEETYYVDEIDAVLSKLNTKIIYTLHVHSLITIITVVIFMASPTHPMQELVNVLCLNEKGEMILRHKMDCAFNEKQKRKEHVVKSTVKSSGDDGDEYETY